MSGNLKATHADIEQALANARSIADIMRIARVTQRQVARVVRVACGYRIGTPVAGDFTSADLAWFARPIGGAL